MEKEQGSLSDLTDGSSNSSESLKDFEYKNEELESYETYNENGQKSKNRVDLVLDLRHATATDNHSMSVDDSASEKLSAVFEQPEDPLPVTATTNEPEEIESEESKVLRERIKSLKELMKNLREELKKEVALWKKEREEFQMLRERNELLALEEATAAARAAAAAYAAEAPLSNDLDDVLGITSEQALRELTILEYERKLAKYQDAISLAQAEKRYNVRRQMVAKAYEKRLAEVERLCNEELQKIRQNANNLQPLKEMISQWYMDNKNHGDVSEDYDASLQEKKNSERLSYRSVDAEVNMIPEILVSRFKNDDITKRSWSN